MSPKIKVRPNITNTFLLRQRAGGWFVITAEGEDRAGPFQMRNFAEGRRRELQLAANKQRKIGPRPCITCGETFQSEGPHNRMCTLCRHQSEAFSGVASVTQRGARRVTKN